MRSTTSLWEATDGASHSPLARSGPLARDLDVDVAIIGAGITGLTTALQLSRAGVNVVVLEARGIGSGVSGGTTAHITEAIDTRYHTIRRDFGAEGARLAATSSRTAIEHIAAVVSALRIECEFERVPGYLFTERDEHVRELEQELDAALEAGVLVSRVEDPLPFVTRAALRFDNQAQFHPLKYLNALAAHLREHGCPIYEQTRVLAIEEGDRCTLHVDSGARICATHVVVATHAPLNKLLLQTKVASYRSYVVAGTVEKAPVGLFWDTDDPYHYVRTATVGSQQWLIVGGEDHKTGQSEEPERAFDRLAAYAARFGLTELVHRWSAQVVEPVDGLPFIGRNALSSRVFVATGYSGNGMTFGTLAGLLLSDAVLDRPNRYRALYEATRVKPLASAGTYLEENVDYPLHLLGDRLRPSEVRSTREVARGEGRVLHVEGTRVAAYRDDEGVLRCVSAVCTHMGCLVHFNAAERTWDCPCHGARYDTLGEVLDGPATRPLRALTVLDEGDAAAIDAGDEAALSGTR